MNTGPNLATPSRSFLPRVRLSLGVPSRSSYVHVAYTDPTTANTSAARTASSPGDRSKYAPTSSILRVKSYAGEKSSTIFSNAASSAARVDVPSSNSSSRVVVSSSFASSRRRAREASSRSSTTARAETSRGDVARARGNLARDHFVGVAGTRARRRARVSGDAREHPGSRARGARGPRARAGAEARNMTARTRARRGVRMDGWWDPFGTVDES